MNVVPLVESAPFWIESSDVVTHEQSGSYVIDGEVVAGYSKAVGHAVMAECFLWDDMCEKEVVMIQNGRRAPFRDIDSAKEALQMIARPTRHTRIIL